ncbi:MAG: LytR/AlgR family response regulator transcription factor [Mucilaginibacter sp.]
MLTAIAIDDEPLALEVIKNLAQQVPFINLAACFARAMDAITFLQQEKADLMLLDIKMPDITGIDFLRSISNPPMVIFTTAYSEHAVQSFELNAIDYLLKPFSLPRFLKACNKAAELHALKHQLSPASPASTTVFIKSGYEQVRIDLNDIRYVESVGNYVRFVLSEGKVISRLTMQDAAELLPMGAFIRIHRSYLAAKNKITKIDKHTVWLGPTELPAGEAYYPDIERFLNNK